MRALAPLATWVAGIALLGLLALPAVLAARADRLVAPRAETAITGDGATGQVDLSGEDPAFTVPIRLTGPWAYWGGLLLDPAALAEPDAPEPDGYVALPRRWAGDRAGGSTLGSFGAATYRLSLRLPEGMAPGSDGALALRVGEMFTASRVFVNGVEVAALGRPALDAAGDVPKARAIVVTLPRARDLDIVVQISNHFHHEGGPIGAILLGRETALREAAATGSSQRVFLTGAVAAMGLFYLALFAAEGRERGYLYFAILSFLCVIRVPTASRTIYDFLPSAPHAVVAYLEYASMYLLTPAYIQFQRWLFPEEMPRLAVGGAWILGIGLSVLALVLPAPFMTLTRDPYLVMVVGVILLTGTVLALALHRRRTGAGTIALAFLVAALCIINDVMLYERWIRTIDLAQVAFCALAFGHAWVLGRGVETALEREGRLARELSALNVTLEAQVRERTRHLETEVERRAAAEAEAAAASRAKSEFLATMSHEIRTPLNGMLGMASLLTDGDLPAAQRQRAQAIVSSGEALLAVINDVLDLSKIEAGRMDLDPGPIEPAALIGAVIELLAPVASAKGLDLRVDLAPDVPARVIGDGARLRQVLANLVGNAIKFTERGGVVVAARLVAPPEAGPDEPVAAGPETAIESTLWIEIAVTDTGIGIPKDQQADLFQPFSQIDQGRTRRFGGTGLGLAISRRLVDLMGGVIGCDSVVGRGSRFWFHLPVGVEAGVAPPWPPGGAAPATTRALRILVAEDNPVNQMVVAGMLGHAGHVVDVVDDGHAAVDAVARGHFDLVLMDLQMPEMDGLEATIAIRALADPERAATPVIALTANAWAEERARCLRAGMNDYLTKPVRREALLARISAIAEAAEGRV